jgi:hypothetical protein
MAMIAVGTAASGLDIFLRYNGVLTDPSSLSYVMKDASSVPVDSGVGYKRSVGHYDARNTVIPSGYDTTNSWNIQWTWQFLGVTGTLAEEFTVVSSMTPSFSNVASLIEKIELNLGLTNEYTQTQMEVFIQKALDRLNRRLNLTGTTSEMSFNDNTGTISPTPDSSLYDLIILQVECMIVKRMHRVAIGQGIKVKDGDTMIDTTSSFGGYKTLIGDVCGELSEAIEEYLLDTKMSGIRDAAELIWYGTRNVDVTMYHNGDATVERDYRSPFEAEMSEGRSF